MYLPIGAGGTLTRRAFQRTDAAARIAAKKAGAAHLSGDSAIRERVNALSARADGLSRRIDELAAPAAKASQWPGGFGEFLIAVHRAENPNDRKYDPRLDMSAAATGLSEQIPADGGFLVPNEFASTLMEMIANETEIAPLCTDVPITKGNRVSFPALDETSRAAGSR